MKDGIPQTHKRSKHTHGKPQGLTDYARNIRYPCTYSSVQKISMLTFIATKTSKTFPESCPRPTVPDFTPLAQQADVSGREVIQPLHWQAVHAICALEISK